MNNLIFFIIKSLIFFNLLIYIIKSFINKKIKTIKVCLCSIGKNENLYVKEFINHYKELGYNHIFIYDNNDINGERFSDVLMSEIKRDFVSVINYIGFRGKYNSSQIDTYYDCYKKNNKNYNWLSFYDFSEFLELNLKNITIQEFLSDKRYKNCINVKVNWVRYSSYEETLYYEDKPLQERFNKTLLGHISNIHIKSTVRGRLKKIIGKIQ